MKGFGWSLLVILMLFRCDARASLQRRADLIFPLHWYLPCLYRGRTCGRLDLNSVNVWDAGGSCITG